jgi:uncharacterized membrane protein YdjX (TVP38/TMEM64 family)
VTTASPDRRIPLRSLLIILILVGFVATLQAVGAARLFTRDSIHEVGMFVQSAGAWGPVVYILLCIVASLLFSPAIPLLLLAGMFGAVKGTVYAVIGLTLGCSASFLFARYALRSAIQGIAQRNATFQKIDDGVKREGWRMVVLTRLVPIFPYNIQNFAYGLTGIRFLTYVVVSGISMLPAITAYVFAGGALISGEGDARKTLLYLAIGGVLFVIISLLPRVIGKMAGGPDKRTPAGSDRDNNQP